MTMTTRGLVFTETARFNGKIYHRHSNVLYASKSEAKRKAAELRKTGKWYARIVGPHPRDWKAYAIYVRKRR